MTTKWKILLLIIIVVTKLLKWQWLHNCVFSNLFIYLENFIYYKIIIIVYYINEQLF
jgi:hypothetical protein